MATQKVFDALSSDDEEQEEHRVPAAQLVWKKSSQTLYFGKQQSLFRVAVIMYGR